MRRDHRGLTLAAAAALLLAGCVPRYEIREFPTSTPSPSASPSAASNSAAPSITLPPDGGFDYQLGGAYEPPAGTAIVARDSTEFPATGLYNICYLNGFQSQPGEADAWAGLLVDGADGPLADPGWPDEYLLDTSTAAHRDAIADMMKPRIDGCAAAGFEAVEFDNLDSYTRSDGALTQADNLALASLYIADAHEAGLAVAQKNLVEFATQGKAAGFDFAVTEECGHYQECDGYLDVYDMVLDIEYSDSATYRQLCASGTLPKQSVRRDLDLTPSTSQNYVFERCA